MLIRNEDIAGVVVEIPDGHLHLRTTITLKDGTELVLQEASMSNVLRAFVTAKTHPTKRRVALKGAEVKRAKKGFAGWQLVEGDEEI